MSQLSKREGVADLQSDIPEDVRQARVVNWGEIVDEYLVGAVSVGRCYAATAFFGRSGWICPVGTNNSSTCQKNF
jgi:hypothetical protein